MTEDLERREKAFAAERNEEHAARARLKVCDKLSLHLLVTMIEGFIRQEYTASQHSNAQHMRQERIFQQARWGKGHSEQAKIRCCRGPRRQSWSA